MSCCNLISGCGLGEAEEDGGLKQATETRFWPVGAGWASLPPESWLILYSP